MHGFKGNGTVRQAGRGRGTVPGDTLTPSRCARGVGINVLLRQHYRWLCGEPDVARPDMHGMDLRGMHLRGVILTFADLPWIYPLFDSWMEAAFVRAAFARASGEEVTQTCDGSQ